MDRQKLAEEIYYSDPFIAKVRSVPSVYRHPTSGPFSAVGRNAGSDDKSFGQQLLDQMWRHHTAQLADDRRWSEEQAQKAMDFSERMRDTAMLSQYRQIKELGLNPALMYSGGMTSASAPTGVAAQTSASATQLAIERERNLYGVLNEVINGAFGLIGRFVPDRPMDYSSETTRILPDGNVENTITKSYRTRRKRSK